MHDQKVAETIVRHVIERFMDSGLRVYLAGVVVGYAVMAFEVTILGEDLSGTYEQTFLLVYGVPAIVGLLAIRASAAGRTWWLAAGALPVFFLHVALLVNIAINPMHLIASALLSLGILKSFHARSSQAALNDDPNSVEFKLDAGPPTQAFLRVLLVMALIGEAILIALYLAGNIDGEFALIGAIALVVYLVLAVRSMWLTYSGVVLLKADELEVRTRDGRQLYWWDDIAEIRALKYRDLGLSERLVAGLTGFDPDLWLVKITLRRWHRFSLSAGNVGTKPPGIPVPGMKTVHIYVSDPAAFARAANAFLLTG